MQSGKGPEEMVMFAALIDEEPQRRNYETIYAGYRQQMLAVAFRVLGDAGEAEDAVQNAFLGIAKHIDKVPAGNEKVLRAYVLTAARNAALSLLEKRQQRPPETALDEAFTAADEDLFRRVAASEDYEALMRAMRRLELQYREVLMLVFVQEHTVKEAAEVLGRKEGTVRQQLNRGRKKLIELCKKEGILDEWTR